MTKADDMEMVVARLVVSVVVPLEVLSEAKLLRALVELPPAIHSEPQVQVERGSDRQLLLASVVVPAFSMPMRTNLLLVDSLVHKQAQLLLVDCLEQHLKTQARPLEAPELPLARLGLIQIHLVPAKHKASLVSSVAPAAGLEEAQLEVDYSVVQARPDSEPTSLRRAQLRLVLLAHRINRFSKVKIRTNQEVSSAAEDLEIRRQHKRSLLVVYSVQIRRRLVEEDCLVATQLDKARQGLVLLARIPVEVSSVGLEHSNKNQVYLVELLALELRRTRIPVDCSVALLPLNNKVVVFSERPRQTILVDSSTIVSNSRSPAYSEHLNLTQACRTTVYLVDSLPTASSTRHSKTNRHHNSSLKPYILPSWMAILMVSRQSGLDFLKLHHKIPDLSSHLCLLVSV
jgi:hypothetical protein